MTDCMWALFTALKYKEFGLPISGLEVGSPKTLRLNQLYKTLKVNFNYNGDNIDQHQSQRYAHRANTLLD